MSANTTNLALTQIRNVYVLSVTIITDYRKKELNWNFLVRKKGNNRYYDLFTNKEIHWLGGSKIVFGILGEYENYFETRFKKITPIQKYSTRFMGMDIESFAALNEFINYINIMSNITNEDSNVTFEP